MPWADPGSLRAVLVQRPLGRRPGLGLSPGGLAGSVGEAAICRNCASLSSVTGLSATMSPLLSPDLTSVIASLVTPSTTTRHAKPPSGCCTATWSLPSNRTTDAFGRVSTLSNSLSLISTRAVIPGRRAGSPSSIRTLVVWNLLSVLTNEVASGNGALPVVRQPDPLGLGRDGPGERPNRKSQGQNQNSSSSDCHGLRPQVVEEPDCTAQDRRTRFSFS